MSPGRLLTTTVFALLVGAPDPSRAFVAGEERARVAVSRPVLVGPAAVVRAPAAPPPPRLPRAFPHVTTNAWTGLPHRAWGPPVPSGVARVDDAASAEAAARAFLARDPDAWFGGERPGADRLVLAKCVRVGRTWFVAFGQRHRGVDVDGGRVDVRITTGGDIVLAGSDWFPGIDASVVARFPHGVADARARGELGFDPARDRALEGRTVLLPWPGADGRLTFRLVHRVRHRLSDPPALWASDVDAHTGETLAREDELRHATLEGTVRGLVHPATPTDPPVLTPLRDALVRFDSDSTTTAVDGRYALPGVNGQYFIRNGLRGPGLEVLDATTGPYVLTQVAPLSGPLDFTWTDANSDTAARDAFHHALAARAWLKALDPAFTGLDFRMPCTVNLPGACAAFFDGLGLNFVRWGLRLSDGVACANTATIADVVIHEYGHARTQAAFAPFVPTGPMHEGFSDYFAAAVTGQPDLGRGFFGPGTIVRSAQNTRRLDDPSCVGLPHCVGEAIAGALWDLRTALAAAHGAAGARTADSLFHLSSAGGATWHDDWLLDLLVVDDDAGSLADGTPHFDAIRAAFEPRGFVVPALGPGVWIEHEGLPDVSPGSGPWTVEARIGSRAGQFLASSPTLAWWTEGTASTLVPMTAAGGGVYRATIPALPPGGVSYRIRASDAGTGTSAWPPSGAHRFDVGALAVAWSDDFETDRGWTGSIAGASAGRWMRVDPNGTNTGGTPPTEFSPEDDFTPGAGRFCWVTHDTTAGLVAGTADVDGGCVTLVSPAIDLSGIDDARIGYARWFHDATRLDDTLAVDVSADFGATWTPLERVVHTVPGWQRVEFDLDRVVVPGTGFRLRVTVCDDGVASLLEAALDDVTITTRQGGTLAGPPTDVSPLLRLAAPAPSPARAGEPTRIAFTLPAGAAAAVRLEILDVRGRLVRRLLDGPLPPGPHARAWDGRDEAGREAPPGVYGVRLVAGTTARSGKCVRVP